MKNQSIKSRQNLYSIPMSMKVGKRVKFWYDEPGARYESTGIVTEYIVAENCLTVKDDRSGMKYYIGADQVEILKEDKADG